MDVVPNEGWSSAAEALAHPLILSGSGSCTFTLPFSSVAATAGLHFHVTPFNPSPCQFCTNMVGLTSLAMFSVAIFDDLRLGSLSAIMQSGRKFDVFSGLRGFSFLKKGRVFLWVRPGC
jgi:hypothetical protein